MKLTSRFLLLIFVMFVSALPTVAQQELDGTWEGELAVSADQSIDVQFIFTRAADGSLSAVLNAPDQPSLRNVPVNALSFHRRGIADVSECCQWQLRRKS